MNRLTIIGNLTRDPEQRTTPSGATVCSFTVAVNRRGRRDAQNNQPEADFFRVSAWNQLADICQKYLAKGNSLKDKIINSAKELDEVAESIRRSAKRVRDADMQALQAAQQRDYGG